MCSGGPILTIQKFSLGKEIILGPRGYGRDLSETRKRWGSHKDPQPRQQKPHLQAGAP